MSAYGGWGAQYCCSHTKDMFTLSCSQVEMAFAVQAAQDVGVYLSSTGAGQVTALGNAVRGRACMPLCDLNMGGPSAVWHEGNTM